MFTTYVLENEVGGIYIGYTDDVVTRLQRHNGELPSKKGSYTHTHRQGVWKLVYVEEFQTRSEAMKREKQLKSSRGRQFIRNVMGQQ